MGFDQKSPQQHFSSSSIGLILLSQYRYQYSTRPFLSDNPFFNQHIFQSNTQHTIFYRITLFLINQSSNPRMGKLLSSRSAHHPLHITLSLSTSPSLSLSTSPSPLDMRHIFYVSASLLSITISPVIVSIKLNNVLESFNNTKKRKYCTRKVSGERRFCNWQLAFFVPRILNTMSRFILISMKCTTAQI